MRLPVYCLQITAVAVTVFHGILCDKAISIEPPPPARVAEIAKILPSKPAGIGVPIGNRAAWEKIAGLPHYAEDVLRTANRLLEQDSPQTSEADYLEFSKTGNRSNYEGKADSRRHRLSIFVQAEGLENKGRFLPYIKEELAKILAEPTWVLPSHDKGLENFKGTKAEIDLWTAMTVWNLATADTILGDHLDSETRAKIRAEAQRRVFQPMLAQIRGEGPAAWWIASSFNWNAVVHAGVTGAALALVESPEERAEFAVEAEQNIRAYLGGFKADGYAEEGLSYWNYGFGHYVLLAETLLQATNGRINLYAEERARRVAQFPKALEVLPGTYPAFGDCVVSMEPSAWVLRILNARYQFGWKGGEAFPMLDSMYAPLLYAAAISTAFSPGEAAVSSPGQEAFSNSSTTWFPESQVLIARPLDPATGLGLACKGGNNGESHGHLDQGSFAVFSGDQGMIIDPGAAVYSAATFDSRRYDNKILNSYGHSVPVVAGQLQKAGTKHGSRVVEKASTDDRDSLVLDLADAYSVPSVKRLTRRFDYDRTGASCVTITDTFEFSSPEAFATALVTFGTVREVQPGVLTITRGGRSVQVEVSTGGAAFTLKQEIIPEKLKSGPEQARRIEVALKEKTTDGQVVMRITPVVSANPASQP